MGLFSNSSLRGSWDGGVFYLADERALFVLLLFLITFILSHPGSVMQNGLLENPEENWKGQNSDAIDISA